jgi:large subunit ribosomal protein L51
MLKTITFLNNIFKNEISIIRGLKTRGEYFKNIGYAHSNIYKGGLLPRPDQKLNDEPLPMPEYRPKDTWTEKKATFGQNDYIDILGDGDVKPVDLIRGPRWLIGFKGNELQRITRQLKFEGYELKAKNPNKFHDINKRVKYLMWRYNKKFGGIKK